MCSSAPSFPCPQKGSSAQSDGRLHFFTFTSLSPLKAALVHRCHFITWRKMQIRRNKRDLWKLVHFFVILRRSHLHRGDLGVILLCFWLSMCTPPCVLIWSLEAGGLASGRHAHNLQQSSSHHLIFPVSWSSLASVCRYDHFRFWISVQIKMAETLWPFWKTYQRK